MWEVGKGAGHLSTGLEGSEGKYSFFNLDDRWDGWSTTLLGCFTAGKQSRYPLYRRLDGPQGRFRRLQKIWPLPTAVDPRTVEPVERPYTDTLHALLRTDFYRHVQLGVFVYLLAGPTVSLSVGFEDGC